MGEDPLRARGSNGRAGHSHGEISSDQGVSIPSEEIYVGVPRGFD